MRKAALAATALKENNRLVAYENAVLLTKDGFFVKIYRIDNFLSIALNRLTFID